MIRLALTQIENRQFRAGGAPRPLYSDFATSAPAGFFKRYFANLKGVTALLGRNPIPDSSFSPNSPSHALALNAAQRRPAA